MDKVKEYPTLSQLICSMANCEGKYSTKSLPEITGCIYIFSEAADDLLQGSNEQ